MADTPEIREAVDYHELGWAGNVFTRALPFERAGQALEGHTHNFAHCHFVAQGPERIRLYEEDGRFRSIIAQTGERLQIEAHVRHQIESLLPPADVEQHRPCSGRVRRVSGQPWCESCLVPIAPEQVVCRPGLSALGMCVFAARDADGQITELMTDEIKRTRFSHEREGGGRGRRID